jgi:peptidoglycan hydrolase-like protein with peptidoglycan-binding domain
MRITRLIGLVAVVVGLTGHGTADAAVTTLQLGDVGGEVATWQAAVNKAWLYNHPARTTAEDRFIRAHGLLAVDGVFGPLTRRATRLYQLQYDLPVTGIVTFQSWKATLGDGLGNCCDGVGPTVQEGDSSAFVAWLQISIDRWIARSRAHIRELMPDGVFGPLTEAATIAYQRAVGLDGDGVAGPQTWGKLGPFTHLP